MSSNMKIVKICEACNREYIAKTTTSKTCSEACAKRNYAMKKRNEKIAQAEKEVENKRRLKVTIAVDQIQLIQAKQYLTLKEAAVLLNVSPLTLRRWTLDGKMNAQKVGKKWMYQKERLVLFA